MAISTCPNDTFAFDRILRGDVCLPRPAGAEPWSIELLDIQQLNDGFREGRFDVAKVSFAAAGRMDRPPMILDAGSAIGFGVGPLMLGPPAGVTPRSPVTLCPGADTTATALLSMFHPDADVRHVVFSDIMPALARGDAAAGVCIHEGRFTYADHGLTLIDDLGQRWHDETDSPLPLGGIAARGDLPPSLAADISGAIASSVRRATADPESALPTMRRHAREMNDDVLNEHVRLYVNDQTISLGEIGRTALEEFWRRLGRDAPPRIVGTAGGPVGVAEDQT